MQQKIIYLTGRYLLQSNLAIPKRSIEGVCLLTELEYLALQSRIKVFVFVWWSVKPSFSCQLIVDDIWFLTIKLMSLKELSRSPMIGDGGQYFYQKDIFKFWSIQNKKIVNIRNIWNDRTLDLDRFVKYCRNFTDPRGFIDLNNSKQSFIRPVCVMHQIW